MNIKVPETCGNCVAAEEHCGKLMCGFKKQSSNIVEMLINDPNCLVVDPESRPEWCNLKAFASIDESNMHYPLAVAILEMFHGAKGFCKE